MYFNDIGDSLVPVIMGIVKTMSQSRVIENAQRERIAAIQAGIDPAKLPPIPNIDMDGMHEAARSPEDALRRRTNGLMVGGIVTLFAGAGLALFLWIADAGGVSWAVGVIPVFVGIALLLSAFLVRPRGGI
jgi:hypothetical protein